jgi:replicative DNA helicase
MYKKMNNSGKLTSTPQSIELEEIVLGAIMLEREAYHEISALINEHSFYDDKHQKIFKAIKTLFAASSPIDIITVCEQLRKLGTLESVGGPYYVTNLTNRVSSSANIAFHAGIIQQKYVERQTLLLAGKMIQNIHEGTHDIFNLQDEFVNNIQKLTESTAGQISELGDIITVQLKNYEIKHESGLTGVPSGLYDIDHLTSGWQKSNLIILAGRPAMGKTAFMLNIARNAWVLGEQPVAIFSLEMSKEQLTDRLIAAETGIPLDLILSRKLQPHHFKEMHNMKDLFDTSIHIDDTAGLNIQSFRSKCARLKRNHDIGLIVVDYLQLMKGEAEYKNNREQEISSISRGLKAVAKDLNVPVMALSQLSRKVEERQDKRPLLSDLRESGSIEQDADQVIFLFRPEYYGINQDSDGNSMRGMAEVIFAKNRNGPTDTLITSFNGSKMKFSNLTSDHNSINNQINHEQQF